MVKRNERFYHLRITKTDGPFLHRSCTGFTDDPREAFLGNAKHTKAMQAQYPLAWIMERVPSLHRQVKA